jgi:hypothetical protein
VDYHQDGSGMLALHTLFCFPYTFQSSDFVFRITGTTPCGVVSIYICFSPDFCTVSLGTMQMFFPLVFDHHWVLVCVSMFMKQIAFFDSLIDSKESTCLKRAKNLVSSFLLHTQSTFVEIAHFRWLFFVATYVWVYVIKFNMWWHDVHMI